MRLVGATLDDVPARLPWRALRSFAAHLGPDSALAREVSPEAAEWASPAKAASILADVFDAVQALAYNVARAHGGHPRRPKRYPRPGDKDSGERIGSDPIPVKDFDEWWIGG